MDRCGHHQDLLLDYLYDLLDGEPHQELETHLRDCSACQAALARARTQQRLLATAAHLEFAGVQFMPPVLPLRPERKQPARLQLPRLSWVGWGVAAAVLLALGGLSVPAFQVVQSYRQLSDEAAQAVARHDQVLAEARLSKDHADKQAVEFRHGREELLRESKELPTLRDKDLEQLVKDQNERQVEVSVTGPTNLQPGKTNIYDVQVTNFNGTPVDAELQASLVYASDGKDAKPGEPGSKHSDDKAKSNGAPAAYPATVTKSSQGNYRFAFGPDVPLIGDSTPTIQVIAKPVGGLQVPPLTAPVQVSARTVYGTHLDTDKPLYQLGETMRFRSLTLERYSLRPPTERLHLVFQLKNGQGQPVPNFQFDRIAELADEHGQPLLGPDRQPIRGIGTGEFVLDSNVLTEGEYTLEVREVSGRFPAQERKIHISRYEPPLLNKELDFGKKSYGAGEEVTATARATVAGTGSPLASRKVSVTVKVDGRWYSVDGKPSADPVALDQFSTDPQGVAHVRFKLPAQVERGEAALAVTFDDGRGPETIARPIPVVSKKLDVEFFPEGGYLVPGVVNRVYFQARTTLGKPAELRGRIVDQDGKVARADVQTLNDAANPGVNQGLGVFEITPQPGRAYHLEVDQPIGIASKPALPPAEPGRVALSIPGGVFTDQEPIKVTVRSDRPNRNFWVGVYCRGRVMASQRLALKGNEASAELLPAQPAGGVFRITVFEDHGSGDGQLQLFPVAERLVYCAPTEQLHLRVNPDRARYTPGDKVHLGLQAVSEKDQPAPAIVQVAVVDRRTLALADEKTARSMPTQFYLASEVRGPEDLEYADFLLTDHPQARAALDLLLGTQGWRRFAEYYGGDPHYFHLLGHLTALAAQVPLGPLQVLPLTVLKPEETELLHQRLEHIQKPDPDLDRLFVLNGQSIQTPTGNRADLHRDFLSQRQREEVRLAYARRETQTSDRLAQLEQQHQEAQERYEQEQEERKASAAAALKDFRSAAAEKERYDEELAQLRLIGLPVLEIVLALVAAVALAIGVRRRLARAVPCFLTSAVCALAVVLILGYTGRGVPGGLESSRQLAGDIQTTDDRQFAHGASAGDEAHAREPGGTAGPNGNPDVGTANGAGGGGVEQGPPHLGFGGGAGTATAPTAGQTGRENADAKFVKDRQAKDEKAAVLGDGEVERVQPNHVEQWQLRKQAGQGGMGGRDTRFPGKDGQSRAEGKKKTDDTAPVLAPGPFPGGAPGMFPPMSPPAGRGYQPQPQFFMVRVYAHENHAKSKSEMREDFTETVYWHPALVLSNGKIDDLQFALSDSVTTYQVIVSGHTPDGRLGATTATIEAPLPFTVEPKLPLEVTAGDRIDMPVAVANNTREPRDVRIKVTATGLERLGSQKDYDKDLHLAPEGTARRLYEFRPGITDGQAIVEINGEAKPFETDAIRKSIKVVPAGFPVVGSNSSLLEGAARDEVVLPETWVKGSLKVQVQAYPSTLADLQNGLEALLREPNGCFEQTSSSNYPNLLILDYLKQSDQARPEVEQRARALLDRGYQKLLQFECQAGGKREGYEWFGGQAPPHEALTAYGLMEFRDMGRVAKVDEAMVQRTRAYLMAQKDGQGGFQRNTRAIDSFGRAPQNVTNAYIVWALTESGADDDLEKELVALNTQAKDSKDPYFVALVANSLLNRGRTADAVALMEALGKAQKEDGRLDAETTSITGSGGRDLQIETTALAVLAWLKQPQFTTNVNRAVKWLGQQRGGRGGFGSTQSTILALKALIAHAKANKHAVEAGNLKLSVGERSVAQVSFPAGAQDTIALMVPDPEKVFKPGKNPVRIDVTGKNVFPYTLSYSYSTLKPASADDCPVKLRAKLDRTSASEGDLAILTVAVENADKDKGQGMAVAVVGLPAGMTLPEDLKQFGEFARTRDSGRPAWISAWEVRGRELVLYWRDLGPGEKIEVPLQLICRIPGEYRGPASRAYLYYNADRKCWVEPLQVTIQAKQ